MASVTLAGVLLLANVGSNLGVDGISTVQHDAYESAVNVPPSGHQRAASDASMVCARHHASNPLHAVQNTSPGSRGTSGATLSAALASNSGLLSLSGHRRAVTHSSVSGRAIVRAILHESLNFDFTAPNGTSSGAEVEYPTFVAQLQNLCVCPPAEELANRESTKLAHTIRVCRRVSVTKVSLGGQVAHDSLESILRARVVDWDHRQAHR